MNRRNKLSKLAVLLTLVMALTLIVTALFTPTALAEGEKVVLVTYNGAEQEATECTDGVLPSADGFTKDGKTYEFVGWVAVEDLLAEADTTAPTTLKVGDAYGDAKQLHALYSYDVTTTTTTQGEAKWTLVKNVADLAAGDQVIIAAKASAVAMSTNQKSNNRGQATITKSGDNATLTADVEIFTLEAGTQSNTFSFADSNYNGSKGYLYAAGGTGSNNYLKTKTTKDATASWTITITSAGVATVKTADTTVKRHTMMYNSGSSLFACYASGQQDICLYKLTASTTTTTTTTTYYQTFTEMVEDTACEHINTTVDTTPATCTKDGSIIETCDECGFIVSEETIEAKGHTEGTPVVDKATCTEDGSETVSCTVCSEVISTKVLTKTGHTDGEPVIDPATCTEDGKKTYTCTVCGEISKTETIAKLGHNYVDGTCSECGEAEPEELKFVIATKRSSGNYFYMTSNLGTASTKRYQAVDSELTTLPTEILSDTIDAVYVFILIDNGDGTYKLCAEGVSGDEKYLGWTSGNSGALVSEANAKNLTLAEQSNGTFHISFKNGSETRYLQLNNTSGNNYFAWYTSNQAKNLVLIPVVEPQPEPEPEPTPEPTVTEFAGAQVSLGADLTVNYKVTLAEGENIADYLVRFTMNGESMNVTDYRELDGAYVFAFTGIAPQCAGDTILAELVKGEEVVATKDGYSVLANVTNLYNKEGVTEATKLLIADLLNYCAAAQKYAGYKTDALVNAGFETVGSTVTPDESDNAFTGEATGVPATVTEATVLFDSVNYVVVTYGARIDGVTIKVNGTELTGTAIGNDLYTVSTEGIGAKNFDEIITVELFLNGEKIQTVTYSVNTYIYRTLNNPNASEAMKELALALYRYGVSAENY